MRRGVFVDRRIGGLEITVDECFQEYLVDRRIGGLEITVDECFQEYLVDRRIGGLASWGALTAASVHYVSSVFMTLQIG